MRFYYENALEFSLIAKIMGEKFTSYYRSTNILIILNIKRNLRNKRIFKYRDH